MKQLKPLQKRAVIIGGFTHLGFTCRTAFYNVCKSLDSTLNGFELINFYNGEVVSETLVNRLEAVLEMLKNE